MAIDNPLSQAELVLANEARDKVPVARAFQKISSFITALAGAATALKIGKPVEAVAKLSDAVAKISEALSEDNSAYLLSIVISELKWLEEKFEVLSEAHQEFLNKDWLGLLVDADRKARQTRSRERVARIAQILCNAAQASPCPSPDTIEEMTRIAMYLDDSDVKVLGEAVRIQAHLVSPRQGKPTQWQGMDSWRRGEWRTLGFSEGELDSICGKLQSFGLLVRLDQPNNQNVMAVVANDCLLLQRGLEFVNWARSKR